jgi:hypothetical protein
MTQYVGVSDTTTVGFTAKAAKCRSRSEGCRLKPFGLYRPCGVRSRLEPAQNFRSEGFYVRLLMIRRYLLLSRPVIFPIFSGRTATYSGVR